MKKVNIKINKLNFRAMILEEEKYIIVPKKEYAKGDIIALEECDTKGYTGKYIHVEVTGIDDGQIKGLENTVVLNVKLRLDRGALIDPIQV